MIEPRLGRIRVPNSTFDTQDQGNGSVLVLRHGVPVGRMKIQQQKWAGYIIKGDGEVKVCQYLDYNESLWELAMKVQQLKLEEQVKKLQHEKR
jgi:hypothetical protein